MEEAIKRLEAFTKPVTDAFALVEPPGPNCCQVCGGGHQPDMPHNQQAMFYQQRFLSAHGRYPTWADAIAHCSESMRKAWTTALKEQDAWSEPAPGVPVVMHFDNGLLASTEPDMKIGAASYASSLREARLHELREPGGVAWLTDTGQLSETPDENLALRLDEATGKAKSWLSDQLTQRDTRIAELKAYIEVLKAERNQLFSSGLIRANWISALEEALQPFAAEGARWHESFADNERPHCLLPTMTQSDDTLAAFTLADLRRAATLEPSS